MRTTIWIDTNEASCTQSDPDVWMEHDLHSQAAKVCEGCSQNVNCYLVGLIEKRYGTWGGAWFSLHDKRHIRLGTKFTDPWTRRAIHRTIDFFCAHLGISHETFAVRYGRGESGIHKAFNEHFRMHEYVPAAGAIRTVG